MTDRIFGQEPCSSKTAGGNFGEGGIDDNALDIRSEREGVAKKVLSIPDPARERAHIICRVTKRGQGKRDATLGGGTPQQTPPPTHTAPHPQPPPTPQPHPPPPNPPPPPLVVEGGGERKDFSTGGEGLKNDSVGVARVTTSPVTGGRMSCLKSH